MRTKLFLTTLLLLFIFLFSCKEFDDIVNDATSNSELKKESCEQHIVYQWEFDHYSPITGKELGFYPNYSYINMTEMKTKYGFSNVFIRNNTDAQNAINAGFTYTQMMAVVNVNDTGNYTIPNGNFGSYYVEEYFERLNRHKTYARLIANDLYPKPVFFSSWKLHDYYFTEDVMSKYKWVLSECSNARIICDQYHDETFLCGNDQRDHWSTFKNEYGEYRVSAHWIHLYIDGEEGDFDRLFRHAPAVGVNKLWLFIGNKGNDYCDNGESMTQFQYKTYLDTFLDIAYQRGWLKRYYRLYRYTYRCLFNNPCETCDQNDINGEGWVVESRVPTNQIQEM